MSKESINDDVIICLSDLWALLHRGRRIILWSALTLAVLFFGYGLFKTPLFKTEATFREKQSKGMGLESGSAQNLLSMLSPLGSSGDSFAIPMFTSRTLIEEMIRDCGIQAQIVPEGRTLRLLKNVRDNILTEASVWRNRASEAVKYRIPNLQFSDIAYDGYEPILLYIDFIDVANYVVRDSSFKELGKGCLGKKCEFQYGAFTLFSYDQAVFSEKHIPIILEPMHRVYKRVSNSFSAKVDLKLKSLIRLQFVPSNPLEGIRFINGIMDSYNRHTKKESERTVDEQIHYLQRAKNRSLTDLDKHLDEYCTATKECIGTEGVLSAKDGAALWVQQQQRFRGELLVLENELAALSDQNMNFLQSSSPQFGAQITRLYDRIRALNLRKNSLEESLHGSLENSSQKGSCDFHKELEQEQSKARELEQFISIIQSEVGQSKEVFSLPLALQHSDPLVMQWLAKLELGDLKIEEKEGLIDYLSKLIKNSERRCKVLKEKFQPTQSGLMNAEGMTLEAADRLYGEVAAHLGRVDLQIAHIKHALEKLDEPTFEVSSLSSVVQEDVARQMVSRAGQLVVQLQDKKNYSEKERSRIASELALQKKAIKIHLKDTLDLLNLENGNLEKRNLNTRKITFDLISQEIALLKDQLDGAISARKKDLGRQKNILESQIAKIKVQMSALPKRWVDEKKLQMQSDLQSEVMKTLSTLVESKRISNNLDIIESKPLDPAVMPIRPEAPGLVKKPIVGGMLGSILACAWLIAAGFIRGVSVSPGNLQVAGLRFLGKYRKQDKQVLIPTLQRAVHEVIFRGVISNTKDKVTFWMGEYEKSLLPELKKLLVAQGKRALILEATFKGDKGQLEAGTSGLLQYFEGGPLPKPIEEDGIGVIQSKGSSNLVMEYLTSKRFEELIQAYEGQYDVILVCSDIKALSPGASALLNNGSRFIVNVSSERIQDLRNFYGPISKSFKNIALGFIYFEPDSKSLFHATSQ